MELLEMTSSPTPSVKRKLIRNSNFVLEGGVLYYQGKGKFQRVLFTPEKKREAFEEAHVVSAERHHGIRATGINITKSYYWPRITLHARQWVKECKKCQRDKLAKQEAQSARVKARKRKGVAPTAQLRGQPSASPPLRLLPPAAVAPKREALAAQARGLFHLVGLQLVGPMEQTPRGACFIFVVVDHYTRWVEVAPMKTCSPEETAEQVLKLVYRFGFPERIVCCQSGDFVRQLNQILRIQADLQCDLVANYRPRTHGLLEMTNAFVQRLLTLVVRGNTANWDLELPNVLFLQMQAENESEEEDLGSEEDLEGDDAVPPAPFPSASEPSPDEDAEPLVVAELGVEDTCPYCDQLADRGNSEVFTMLQCGTCQSWAHRTCVQRWYRGDGWRSAFRCKACLPAPCSAPE
uniref:Gypsy retrotransposon integrase-like protein 1 n=1 Tax=Sarcophilus harrisii TaxID=9305 RepID=A0A7N4NYH2_SARHA